MKTQGGCEHCTFTEIKPPLRSKSFDETTLETQRLASGCWEDESQLLLLRHWSLISVTILSALGAQGKEVPVGVEAGKGNASACCQVKQLLGNKDFRTLPPALVTASVSPRITQERFYLEQLCISTLHSLQIHINPQPGLREVKNTSLILLDSGLGSEKQPKFPSLC